MARPVLEIAGLNRLRATLKAAGDQLDVGDELKPAFLRAASVVAVRARALAPSRSGALRDTIGPGATKRGGIVRAGFKSIPYAGVQNYGTPKPKGRPSNIAGSLFMQEAAQDTEGQWAPIVFDAVETVLDKIEGI